MTLLRLPFSGGEAASFPRRSRGLSPASMRGVSTQLLRDGAILGAALRVFDLGSVGMSSEGEHGVL